MQVDLNAMLRGDPSPLKGPPEEAACEQQKQAEAGGNGRVAVIGGTVTDLVVSPASGQAACRLAPPCHGRLSVFLAAR